MIQQRSNKTLEQWVEIFIRRLQKQVEADRADNIPKYNRLHKGVVEAFRGIEGSGSRGRDAFEALLKHDMPQVRLWAASAVIEWSPDLAVPVLGKLLTEKFPSENAVMGRVMVRIGASDYLREFFGIATT